jgi:ABC-type lipoprotein export system ATPase subunit
MNLSCKNISCHRDNWNQKGAASVQDLSAAFDAGSLCGVTGPCGSGRNLLLNILGLLEHPDSGFVRVDGVDTSGCAVGELTALRNESFGYLFSGSALLPAFSIAENVAMPLFRICGMDPEEAQERTLEVLDFCGIAAEGDLMAGELDVLPLWRTVFARALVHRPKVLIAISPRQEEDLLPLARRIAEEAGVCVLWGGESLALSAHAHRMIQLENGRIAGDQWL